MADRTAPGTYPLTPAERAVLELIDRNEILTLAVDLVRAGGGNPPGAEHRTVEVLAQSCRDRRLAVAVTEVESERPNLSAVLPGGAGPGLLLLGHTDVVPVGDGWTVEPFGAAIHDGRLFGRGAADMKGGLAACVGAITALARAGVSLAGPVELAAVVDEEDTGKGIRAYLGGGDRSGFGGCIVAEPTGLQTVVAARGDAYVEFEVTGRAAHAGNPDEGSNAIHGAAAIIADLAAWHEELRAHAHPLVGPPSWSVGLVEGGSGASTVPARCRIVADRRLLPAEDAAEVLGEVTRRVAGLGLGERGLHADVRVAMDMPGFETPADHPLAVAAQGAVGAAGGPELPVGGWTAACDGGHVARDAGVPVVVLGPGSVTRQAHRPDESVAVDDLVLAARAYALCVLRLLSDPATT